MTDQHQTPLTHTTLLPTVAMIGGGQLARMTAQAAIELGHTLRVVSPSLEDSAAQVTPDVVVGLHTDEDALRAASEGAAVMTFDHEHVPQEILHTLQEEGVHFHPQPNALLYAQDKLLMRQHLSELGLPVPPFAHLASAEDVERLWNDLQGELIIKTARGGYDGRGVWAPDSLEEAQQIVAKGHENSMTMVGEWKVPWTGELSQLLARSPRGEVALWPLISSEQRDGICAVAAAPAPGVPSEVAAEAERIARTIADELQVTGVLAVELFLLPDGRLMVNELAMRPHNTGHWTQDGCVTSQFEQHIRAVLNYPLGATDMIAPFTVMVNILGAPETPQLPMSERAVQLFERFPQVKLHLYGKEERKGRKLGHINVCGEQGRSVDDADYVAEVRRVGELAAAWMASGTWTDGWSAEDASDR